MADKEMGADRSGAWRAVVEAYQVCSNRYGATLEKCGLTTAQYEVMLVIRTLGEQATPKRIADRLLVTKGNITGVTSRLLSRELISKQAHDSDGRSMIFGLTDAGYRLLSDAQAVASEFVNQQLEPFSDAEVEIVGRLMRRMKTHLLTIDPETVVHTVSSQR
ncbi:DNA-binding transcriptional regulator, MarR family [Marinobacter sp. es.048]|uniref:MarR family winged helix-turn-helix transcriptional regulator n=1 Tax=Marinobacter sp. es.048 TaxID=1761795 RepID=UPI000B58B86F|nr:MarR family transcriptional regulator [Marinobacter sp. es.048]SNC66020.1 DNA-binding transcriptional regulator, MarR family [Marinobacter sp. es.048]